MKKARTGQRRKREGERGTITKTRESKELVNEIKCSLYMNVKRNKHEKKTKREKREKER